VDYFPRQDITVVLLLGVDQYGPMQASGSYANPGATDMVALLIFDDVQQNCRILTLNRDTMLKMPVLGIGGKQAGSRFGQLALAHTYGSGLQDSCENTKTTISDFLYGLRIDYYMAMNMDAISILNDAVGGVTVQVEDDFSQMNPGIPMGQVTLKGQQAVDFVRARAGVGNQLNISRMERHKEYMDGFMTALGEKLETETATFALNVYDAISPYIVTDCSGTTLKNLMEDYGSYPIEEIVSPEGENVRGEEYYEFYVDEDALDTLILRLFYAPK
jgi:LCP family protein required for cell wall assembly